MTRPRLPFLAGVHISIVNILSLLFLFFFKSNAFLNSSRCTVIGVSENYCMGWGRGEGVPCLSWSFSWRSASRVSACPRPAWSELWVVVGGWVVRTQLGGVHSVLVSAPVNPYTRRMCLEYIKWYFRRQKTCLGLLIICYESF